MAATAEIMNLADALCRACDGLGFDPETGEDCEKCAGHGVIVVGCCDEGECEHEAEAMRISAKISR